MFDFLFKRKTAAPAPVAEPVKEPVQVASDVAPGTHLHYDPQLVHELLADHGRLVELFQDVSRLAQQRDSEALTEQLARFGDNLRGHVLKENVRLYVYLRHSLQADEDSLAIMQEFAHEMHQIGRAVSDFLRKYTQVPHWDDSQWAVFDRDLSAVGKVLTRRIQTEENTLYPLYLPPGDYR